MPRISTLNESYPTDCETLLNLRSQFADRVYSINNNYIYYHLGKNSRFFEHRLVAEIAYSAIPEGYHVHHVNRIRTDNRVSNLRIVSDQAHQRIHRPSTKVLVTCPICEKQTWVQQKRVRRADKVYCSDACRCLGQRRTDRPNRDDLVQLLLNTPNFLAIGDMYNVSDNAVRKWCKSYDLPTKTADWKDQTRRLG